jgi:hypothetical protein
VVTTPYQPAFDIYVGQGDGEWQEASRYHVWTRKFDLALPALSVLERHPEGVARVPEQERVMHRTAAGTPYHIEHLFGFWHTTANDTVFLRAEIDAAVLYTLIVSTTKLGVETIAWYCPKCGNTLHASDFQGRRFGLRAFWKHTTGAAREFNASSLRTCGSCGHVHPPAYGFDDKLDTEEERGGRTQW